MTNHDEETINKVARQAFDNSVEQLDAGTLADIAHCRQQALARRHDRGQHVSFPGLWLPAGALATLALAFGLYFSIASHTGNGLDAEDLDMLSSSESLEFYEDLEFYQWLDENDMTG